MRIHIVELELSDFASIRLAVEEIEVALPASHLFTTFSSLPFSLPRESGGMVYVVWCTLHAQVRGVW